MTEQNGKVPTAALFGVDGTLVDTNYLHAVTCWEAFTQAGYRHLRQFPLCLVRCWFKGYRVSRPDGG